MKNRKVKKETNFLLKRQEKLGTLFRALQNQLLVKDQCVIDFSGLTTGN